MIALGVDVSTWKVAICGIREDGSLTKHPVPLDRRAVGARRLLGARLAAFSVLGAYRNEACIVLVEEPARGDIQRIACVVTEAAQAAIPGAVVMTARPNTWKLEALGYGAAKKPQIMEHARARGYEGDDQDIADAIGIADAAWGRWHASQGEAA